MVTKTACPKLQGLPHDLSANREFASIDMHRYALWHGSSCLSRVKHSKAWLDICCMCVQHCSAGCKLVALALQERGLVNHPELKTHLQWHRRQTAEGAAIGLVRHVCRGNNSGSSGRGALHPPNSGGPTEFHLMQDHLEVVRRFYTE